MVETECSMDAFPSHWIKMSTCRHNDNPWERTTTSARQSSVMRAMAKSAVYTAAALCLLPPRRRAGRTARLVCVHIAYELSVLSPSGVREWGGSGAKSAGAWRFDASTTGLRSNRPRHATRGGATQACGKNGKRQRRAGAAVLCGLIWCGARRSGQRPASVWRVRMASHQHSPATVLHESSHHRRRRPTDVPASPWSRLLLAMTFTSAGGSLC